MLSLPYLKVTKSNKSFYIKDEKDLEKFILEHSNIKGKKGKLTSKELSKLMENERQKLSLQSSKD